MSYRGFTLIELLVTLGIIAVLVGILLPVLGSAKSAARDTTCLGQLDQMHSGWMAVSLSRNGRFLNTVSGGIEERWDYLIVQAMGLPDNRTDAVFGCPALLAKYDNYSLGGSTTYGVNVRWEPGSEPGDNEGRLMSALRQPSTYPLIADTHARLSSPQSTKPLIYNTIGTRPQENWSLGFHHLGGTSGVVYADGSARHEGQGVLEGSTDNHDVPLWFFNRDANARLARGLWEPAMPARAPRG